MIQTKDKESVVPVEELFKGKADVTKKNKMRFYATEQLSENMSLSPEGYLICSGVPLTRTGEFIYKSDEVPIEGDSYGTVRILRDDEEVFKEEALKSFEGKPLCLSHPNEVVTPENWKQYAHGTIQNVRRGEGSQKDLVLADILVTTEKAINLIQSGLREISLGYDAEYTQLSKGLGKQRDIIGNHAAIVVKGRAGGRCAISDRTCDSCGKCGCSIKTNDGKEVKMSIKTKLKKWFDSFPVKDEDLEELEKEKSEDEDILHKENLPIELKEIKDMYDRWIKDAEAGKLDPSLLPVHLGDKGKADKVDKQGGGISSESSAKKGKSIDKRGKSKDEEEGKEDEDIDLEKDEDEEEEKEKTGDRKATADRRMRRLLRDQIGLDARMDEVENKVEGLKDAVEELTETTKEAKDALDRRARDEEEEEEKEEEEAATDCKTGWQDTAFRVNLLNPDMKPQKPKGEFRKNLREIKVDALKGASKRAETKDAVAMFVPDGNFSKLTKDGLNMAFVGASEVVAKQNESKGKRTSVVKDIEKMKASGTVVDINKKNKAFWNK